SYRINRTGLCPNCLDWLPLAAKSEIQRTQTVVLVGTYALKYWWCKPFCHGDRGEIGRSRMPIARWRRAVPYVPRSARPGRIEYDAAEIGGLKVHVLEGQHVTVDSAERAVRAMLHPIIEGLDDIVLEVASPRVSRDYLFELGVSELLIS